MDDIVVLQGTGPFSYGWHVPLTLFKQTFVSSYPSHQNEKNVRIPKSMIYIYTEVHRKPHFPHPPRIGHTLKFYFGETKLECEIKHILLQLGQWKRCWTMSTCLSFDSWLFDNLPICAWVLFVEDATTSLFHKSLYSVFFLSQLTNKSLKSGMPKTI